MSPRIPSGRFCLSLVALLACLGAGCAKPAAKERPQASAGAAESATSSREESRELESKAGEYRDRYQEIQDSEMTVDEKAQAVGDLVDEQQRTVREAEDGGGSEGSSEE